MVGSDSVAKTESVRQASDIVEVVSRYVHLARAGKDFKALCPFHKEKTPSFHVVPDKQIFKCFGCGVGGDVFKFVQLKESVDFLEARSMLASLGGVSLEDDRGGPIRTGQPSKSDLIRVNRWACRWFQKQLTLSGAASVRDYLVTRGIAPASVERFQLGFAPDSWDALRDAAAVAGVSSELLFAAGLTKDRDQGGRYDAFRNRLIFPICDAMDRVVGFGGRALGDDPAKYLNSPQSLLFDKRRCLYGLPLAKDAFAELRMAIIVEGYIDCIIASQFGFPNTVATLGTALTSDHARQLRRYVESAVLVFDSDEAGRRAADASVVTFLAENLDVRLAHVPEGKDPADMLLAQGADAFSAVLTSACDALEFKWKQVDRRYRSASTGPDRRRGIEEFLSLLAKSAEFGACDPIQRGLVLNQVGKLVGLSSEEVRRQLRIIARREAGAISREAQPLQDLKKTSWRPQRAASAAMQQLLEVLINDPARWDAIGPEFDEAWLADGELKAIGRVVSQMASAGGGFTLAALIGRFETAKAATRITDLHMAGARRGNFEETVRGALHCLRTIREQQEIESLTAGLKQGGGRRDVEQRLGDSGGDPSQGGGDENDRVQARAISDGAVARKTNHFAARKHLAAP